MTRVVLGAAAVLIALWPGATEAQSQDARSIATVVSAEDIATVLAGPGGADREIKILDLGRYNMGVAVLRRGVIKPGNPIGGINHTQLTEGDYVMSGNGTLVTGGEVEGL